MCWENGWMVQRRNAVNSSFRVLCRSSTAPHTELVCKHTHTYMHARMYTHTHARMHAHTHTHTHTNIHMCSQTHKHTHAHMCCHITESYVSTDSEQTGVRPCHYRMICRYQKWWVGALYIMWIGSVRRRLQVKNILFWMFTEFVWLEWQAGCSFS